MSAADAVVRFFHAVDDRDWPAVRAGLTDEVTADYSSLSGGAPERLAAGELVTRWQGLLPGFDGTQHLLGPLAITTTGDDATVDANVRAYHRLGESTWVVAGRYLLTLHRADGTWRVAGIVLRTTYQDGDRSLPEQATARVAGQR
ncbi:MAG TPA: nuclear transport factor 2 family protein [Streptosporangiaceae bacterium]|nr:nuclear transport factor 2 family protein [Streptosporangiaceae bacterium]